MARRARRTRRSARRPRRRRELFPRTTRRTRVHSSARARAPRAKDTTTTPGTETPRAASRPRALAGGGGDGARTPARGRRRAGGACGARRRRRRARAPGGGRARRPIPVEMAVAVRRRRARRRQRATVASASRARQRRIERRDDPDDTQSTGAAPTLQVSVARFSCSGARECQRARGRFRARCASERRGRTFGRSAVCGVRGSCRASNATPRRSHVPARLLPRPHAQAFRLCLPARARDPLFASPGATSARRASARGRS